MLEAAGHRAVGICLVSEAMPHTTKSWPGLNEHMAVAWLEEITRGALRGPDR